MANRRNPRGMRLARAPRPIQAPGRGRLEDLSRDDLERCGRRRRRRAVSRHRRAPTKAVTVRRQLRVPALLLSTKSAMRGTISSGNASR